MRWRSPYSLKDAPPTEGSRPKTRKEQYKKRTNILPLATCWRRTVCFVLPAGNFTITTRIGKRGSAGCISKGQKFERDALPEWTCQYVMLGLSIRAWCGQEDRSRLCDAGCHQERVCVAQRL